MLLQYCKKYIYICLILPSYCEFGFEVCLCFLLRHVTIYLLKQTLDLNDRVYPLVYISKDCLGFIELFMLWFISVTLQREKKNIQDLNGVYVFNVADREYLDRPTARLIKEFDYIEGDGLLSS